MLTPDGLIADVTARLGQGYVYGTYFSSVITEAIIQAKAKQYPERYTPDYIERSRKWIGQYAGDCVGLIKAYYWRKPDGSIQYKYEGRADMSASGTYTAAHNKGKINTMPDRPGLGVYKPGHIGVYVGGGYVVESRGVDYGVVKTRLADRGWTHWLEIPYIEYQTSAGGETDMLKQGDQGAAVTLWQQRLIDWNASALPNYGADGSFGAETVTWTNTFKGTVGLPKNGTVDLATWSAMAVYFKGRHTLLKSKVTTALQEGG